MKLKIEDLRNAVAIINRVDDQTGILSSQYVRIAASASRGRIDLALTGLCVGRSDCPVTDLKTDFVWFVDRRVLAAFAKSTKAKEATVDVVNGTLVWKSGKQKIVSAKVDEISGYADWKPAKTSIKISMTPELCAELSFHAKFAPSPIASENMSAVVVSKGYGTLASDMFVISATLYKCSVAAVKIPGALAASLHASDEIHCEETGAGIRYKNGYVYQPLTDETVKKYPMKKLADLLSSLAGAKTLATIKASSFLASLSELDNYAFGSGNVPIVYCENLKAPNSLTTAVLTLDVVSGKYHNSLTVDFDSDFNFAWPLAQLKPWVARIAGLDSDARIACSNRSGCNVLIAQIGSDRHMLALAEPV